MQNEKPNQQLTLIATSPEDFYEGLGKVLRDTLETKLNEIKDVKYSDELMSNKEAAELLRITTQTLRKYCDQGLLPFHMVGGKYLYVKSELIKFLQKSEPEVWT